MKPWGASVAPAFVACKVPGADSHPFGLAVQRKEMSLWVDMRALCSCFVF